MKYPIIILLLCIVGFVYIIHANIVNTDETLIPDSSCIPDTIDIYDDSSITKYVGPQSPFSMIDYKPSDLITVSGDFIKTTKGNALLRQEAMDSLTTLSEAFYDRFGTKLDVVSGYRSYHRQLDIAAGCSALFCARAGYSEHQGGLAIDIFDFSNAKKFLADDNRRVYYERLMQYAHTYGWHNSYQKGTSIDGHTQEPWHRRYLGSGLATYLWENDLTFAECVQRDKHNI